MTRIVSLDVLWLAALIFTFFLKLRENDFFKEFYQVGECIYSALFSHYLFRFKVFFCCLRPTSRGYVKLKSVNPYDHPIINPNYLATEEDREELRDAVRLTREIIKQKAFDPFRGKELEPGICTYYTFFVASNFWSIISMDGLIDWLIDFVFFFACHPCRLE